MVQNIAISTACTTGLHNIGHAARMIAYGDAEGYGCWWCRKASTPLGMAGFGAAKALSTRNDEPQKRRPWDKDRDGFVLGDGAGIMVKIGKYEHAKARGAKIYAEAGWLVCLVMLIHDSPSEDGSGGRWRWKRQCVMQA